MTDNEKKLREILAETLGVPEEQITDTKELVADFGADSLDLVELVMALEDEFDMDVPEIPDEDFERVKTVGDVRKLLIAKGVDL